MKTNDQFVVGMLILAGISAVPLDGSPRWGLVGSGEVKSIYRFSDK